MIEEPFKVFFIAPNEINLDEKNLTRGGMNNLKKVYPPQPPKKPMHKDKKYPMSIFCFEIIKQKLSKKYYDNNKQKYVARIKFEQKSEKILGLFSKTTEYEDFIYFEKIDAILFLILNLKPKKEIMIFFSFFFLKTYLILSN